MKIPVNKINVTSTRFRKDFGDIEALANSIERVGLINPIVVDDNNNLIAGERRYRAHLLLGAESIEVRKLKDLDSLAQRELELEENLHRKDLSWQEEVLAVKELHKLKQEQYGESSPGREGGWTLKDTATSIGVSEATVSLDLELADFVEKQKKIFQNVPTKKKARQVIAAVKERAILKELAKRTTEEEEKISDIDLVNGNCLDELQKLKSNSFDLAIVDPPYGIGDEMLASGDGAKQPNFKNDPEHCLYLYANIASELYRVLKDGTHCYLFIAAQFNETVRSMFEAEGFVVRPVPLIWVKETGRATDMDWKHASMYEAFLFMYKPPSRPLNEFTNDVFIYPRTASTKRIHPMERPIGLVSRLIELSSHEGEAVLDPFAGSFVVGEACVRMGRKYKGIELNGEYFDKGLARVNG